MPRIPETEIARIKEQTDLAALVRSRGIELKKHGSRDLAGCCPFHGDKDPSFIVTPSKGLFHCMGCGAAGNAIQFVERFDKISFRHAYELLAEGGASAFSLSASTPKSRSDVRRLENPFEPEAGDAELMAQVVDYYHERLFKTPDAMDYLKKRGLGNEAMLKHFRIGFADRSLGLRLPGKTRQEGLRIRKRLQQLGIIRESGHEHFNGSIVLPIFDGASRTGNSGHVTEMYGRKINQRLRKGTPLHLYLPGPHAGIWNPSALNSSEITLCEAPFDALTFWVNNFENVTFIYGTQGFTDELFDALLSHNIRRVRLAYDADEAGNRAAERDAERLASVGIEAFRIRFPLGMDANEYATKAKAPYPALHAMINSAEWIGGVRLEIGNSKPESSSRACADISSDSLAANLAASPEPVEAAEGKNVPDSSAPLPQRDSSELIRKGEYHVLQLGDREYRIGGLEKNNSLEVLKITLRLRITEENNRGQGSALFHLDCLDLCRDGDRRRFVERSHEETRLEKELIKRDLGKLLFALEDEQQARINAALSTDSQPVAEMDEKERVEALDFLKSPDLIDRLQETFNDCGLVGEQTNRLAAYLACTSRKLSRPLAVIIQSTSAAGKSTLMEAVLAMFPNEEQVKYSAMTGQSLYYLGETNLKHRILAIVEEEGAEKASYALKLLQSEGELTIASTGKDANTGRMETQEYHVEGPVMIFLTTTSIDIDEELQNRCLTLTVDESREQTERIHALQRQARTLEGLQLKKERQRFIALMQNMQRLIEPVDIVNPYADRLTFTAERTRTRRDHEKYLTLIDAIVLLHQHQRPRKKLPSGIEYIEVEPSDIELANRIAPELFSRSLDELPPQTRLLLGTIKTLVKERCKKEEVEPRLALFSRKDLRERNGWSYSQVKRHLDRLQELEYVAPRHGRMGLAMSYELLVDANESDAPGHIGLIDAAKLKTTTKTRTGKMATLTPPCQNPVTRLSDEGDAINENLSTFSERTSGTPVLVES